MLIFLSFLHVFRQILSLIEFCLDLIWINWNLISAEVGLFIKFSDTYILKKKNCHQGIPEVPMQWDYKELRAGPAKVWPIVDTGADVKNKKNKKM